MTIDTGFDDVLAGEVYVHPEQSSTPEQITVAVNPEPAPCPPPPTPAPAPSEAPDATSASAPSPSPAPPTPLTPATLTDAGIQAAKALVHLPPMTWPELSKLARDVAMDIKERGTILSEHKLSQAQYDFLETYNDYYRNALAEACKQWHAPLSTQERIKVEAAAILEDSLLGIGARMQNKGEGLPGVIEAAKLFAKVAGVGEPTGGAAAPGERFVINIDLGGDTKITVGVAQPSPVFAEGPGALTISNDGEVQGGGGPLRQD